jgi:hypothetical protein
VRYATEMANYDGPKDAPASSPTAKKIKIKSSAVKTEKKEVKKEEAGSSKMLSVEFVESSDED